jgi:hypothetical protein
MTWIIISIPLMLLAIAIAVLPVLLVSISEAGRGFTISGPQPVRRPALPAAYAYPSVRTAPYVRTPEPEEKVA